MKPGRAAAVISATTQPEFRYSEYQSTDYARRYQWPNSFCPSATSFVTTAQAATEGRFALESVEDFGSVSVSSAFPRLWMLILNKQIILGR